ncbi:MAG TPA: amino acid permease [Thermoanaerobaculia bacterium]|nr:amino acid permease [Thermoanaerobaculia bacterium]
MPPAPIPSPAAPTLERAVSRWQIVALALNNVVGGGVFLLPAAAAAVLGAGSLWAILGAGLAILLVVLCFAEAASRFDRAGGAYLYTRVAFGDLVGFEVGWITWLANVAASAALSAGFAQALSYFWPAAAGGWSRGLAVALPLVALTMANVVGVRSGARTAVVLTLLKLAPLALFILVGLFAAPLAWAGNAAPTHPNLGAGVLLLLFAYSGFENAPAPAGEYQNPRKNVAFALLAQIAIVTLLYLSVQWVALRTLPHLAASPAPLAEAARLLLGPWGGTLLAVGTAVSILGTNGNQVLAAPRYLFALARDGFGPAFLAGVHPRFHTPAAAVVVQSAIVLPLALSGSFASLAALSMLALLATYGGTAAAVVVLRRKPGVEPAAFRLPGGPVIPIAAIVLCAGLARSAKRDDLLYGAIAVAVGLVLYLLRRAPRPDPETPETPEVLA